PDPNAKSSESHAYSEAGVDTGEIIIRGGSHLDFSFIPNQAFGASLRGADEIAWYTSAWFDKYIKRQRSADRRLLTNGWREDPVEAAIDKHGDGNAMSFYYYSRLDVHRANGEPVLKIVGAGLGRTGTNSLKLALEQLLGEPCYHMYEVAAHPADAARWHAAVRGEWVDWDELLGGYAATVDWPASAFWAELLE